MTADLFGPTPRRRPGRLRRDLDREVTQARAKGVTPSPALLASLRSLADTIDATADAIAAAHALRQAPATGLVMAQTQASREYRDTYLAALGGADTRDPIDALLQEFSDAAAGNPS